MRQNKNKEVEPEQVHKTERSEPIDDYIGEEDVETDKLGKVDDQTQQSSEVVSDVDENYSNQKCGSILSIGGRQADVAKFHAQACAVPDPVTPTVPDQQTAFLRFNLIREELVELATAMGITLSEDLKPKYYHPSQFNMIEAIDALVDIEYVTNGAYCALGVNSAPFWTAVHENNMTKFIDGWRREDGKWMKGPSYVPVNLKKVYENVYGK